MAIECVNVHDTCGGGRANLGLGVVKVEMLITILKFINDYLKLNQPPHIAIKNLELVK